MDQLEKQRLNLNTEKDKASAKLTGVCSKEQQLSEQNKVNM